MTFNIDLWQSLIALYSQYEQNYLKGKIFFGLAPENTATPYCVIHVIDSGDNPNAQTLCKNQPNYNWVGNATIQFNIYAANDMAIDELLQELNDNIKKLSNLTNYRVSNSKRISTKNASSFSNETGVGITRWDFVYEGL